MKNLTILVVLILSPLTMISQNNQEVINDDTILKTSTELVSNIRNHTYFAAQKEAVKLSHKKSIQLISIKAFRKAAHIKSKDTNRC